MMIGQEETWDSNADIFEGSDIEDAFEPDIDDILGLYGDYGFPQLVKDLHKSEDELNTIFKDKNIIKTLPPVSVGLKKLYEHIKKELIKYI